MFFLNFVGEHASLFISMLSLCASLRALHLTLGAQKQVQRLKVVEVHTEMLRELDVQHAKLGTLQAILAEAALLFSRNEQLRDQEPGGQERVLHNFKALEHLASRYEEKRRLAESSFGEGDVAKQQQILAKIRQLTIHIEQDIAKEGRYVDLLKANT